MFCRRHERHAIQMIQLRSASSDTSHTKKKASNPYFLVNSVNEWRQFHIPFQSENKMAVAKRKFMQFDDLSS